MCGIVGYVGKKQAAPIILEGLRRLEYRGYDSAGISVLRGTELQTRKQQGRIDDGLAVLLRDQPLVGGTGVGHTRWATHGVPSDNNSHPHYDQRGRIAVVHNGVIENFERLKDGLKDHTFSSTTDSEVLAHLIGVHYEKVCVERQGGGGIPNPHENHPLTVAVTNALREVIGTFGMAVVCVDDPNVMVGARRGSPLIVGIGQGENFLASDATRRRLAHPGSHLPERLRRGDFDRRSIPGGQPGFGPSAGADQPARVQRRGG